MQRSAWWLGLAAYFSIFPGHGAVGQANEYRRPTEAASQGAAGDAARTARADRDGSRLRHVLRDQVNSGLVTIILGGLDSGDMTDATDLVTTLGSVHLRVLPVAGQGATKDVMDLLFARGIDIGVVHTDVLSALKRQAPFPGIDAFLQYVARLYDEEIHILARSEIHSLQDLDSKRVNFGTSESESFFTASTIFNVLGIGVDITTLPQPQALSSSGAERLQLWSTRWLNPPDCSKRYDRRKGFISCRFRNRTLFVRAMDRPPSASRIIRI